MLSTEDEVSVAWAEQLCEKSLAKDLFQKHDSVASASRWADDPTGFRYVVILGFLSS